MKYTAASVRSSGGLSGIPPQQETLLAGFANGIVNPSLHAFLTLIVPPAVRSQALTAVLAVNQLAAPVAMQNNAADPKIIQWDGCGT